MEHQQLLRDHIPKKADSSFSSNHQLSIASHFGVGLRESLPRPLAGLILLLQSVSVRLLLMSISQVI